MLTINMRWSEAIPQSFNRYAYVQNDPVNFTDPTGLLMDAGTGTCYVDGIQTNCSTAFFLVNAGAAYVQGGPGFYLGGSVLVTEHQTGIERNSFFQRVRFLDSQNPFKWTSEERGKLDKALGIALNALLSGPCEELLRGRSDNAYDVLKGMVDSKIGFLNRSQIRPTDKNGRQTIAWTRLEINIPFTQPQVDLYAGFFDARREFGLTPDQTRALTILHELGHVTYKYFHGNSLGLGNNMSDAEVGRAIYEKCFSTPFPRGVTE